MALRYEQSRLSTCTLPLATNPSHVNRAWRCDVETIVKLCSTKGVAEGSEPVRNVADEDNGEAPKADGGV